MGYIISHIKNSNSKFTHSVAVAIISFLCSFFVAGVLKLLLARARPFVDLNPYEFFQYMHLLKQNADDYLSAPSGHVVRAISILLPFIYLYKNKLIRIVLAFLIFMVMFARVGTLNHWSSDVVFSLAITLFVVRIASLIMEPKYA
jgi:membrane-associated phospholipid phosphatase